jgi:hypothetical protein
VFPHLAYPLLGLPFTLPMFSFPAKAHSRPPLAAQQNPVQPLPWLQDPEISGLGYINFFWPLFCSVFSFVILMMLRLRLFAALF